MPIFRKFLVAVGFTALAAYTCAAEEGWYLGKNLVPNRVEHATSSPALTPDGTPLLETAKKRNIFTSMADGTKKAWKKTTGIFSSKKDAAPPKPASHTKAGKSAAKKKGPADSQYDPTSSTDGPRTSKEWFAQERPRLADR